MCQIQIGPDVTHNPNFASLTPSALSPPPYQPVQVHRHCINAGWRVFSFSANGSAMVRHRLQSIRQRARPSLPHLPRPSHLRASTSLLPQCYNSQECRLRGVTVWWHGFFRVWCGDWLRRGNILISQASLLWLSFNVTISEPWWWHWTDGRLDGAPSRSETSSTHEGTHLIHTWSVYFLLRFRIYSIAHACFYLHIWWQNCSYVYLDKTYHEGLIWQLHIW